MSIPEETLQRSPKHKHTIDTQSARVYETSEEKKMRKTKLTPELRHSAYLAFQNIRQRCTNRNNKDFDGYGGRGVECALLQEEFAEVYYRTDCCELTFHSRVGPRSTDASLHCKLGEEFVSLS
tara:strand:- start:114 stop:482 length:369 start_codon:yes stop_codon:yes gene_type:complete